LQFGQTPLMPGGLDPAADERDVIMYFCDSLYRDAGLFTARRQTHRRVDEAHPACLLQSFCANVCASAPPLTLHRPC
jgi:hypothetical protein